MERLKIPIPDGGAPYKNQDFYKFLQQNHMISYSSFLDEINDKTTGNCGIILRGFKENHIVLATPPNPNYYTVYLDTLSPTGLQDNTDSEGWFAVNEIAIVNFQLSSEFNIVQVSEAEWNISGDTPLPNGFVVPYGGGQIVPMLYVEAAGGQLNTDPDGGITLVGDTFTLYYVTQTEDGGPWGVRRKGKITIAPGRDPLFFATTISKNFDLTDSFVYIDGEFLEPAPWLATQSQYRPDNEQFYVHKCSDETLESKGVEFKKQRFTKVYDYPEDVVKISYFDISPTDPGINHIEIRALNGKSYLGREQLTPNLPNILDVIKSWYRGLANYTLAETVGTTRHFSRLLKYYQADEDDLFMTFDLRFFGPDGNGFGPMFGFQILNLETRFLLGYATGSNTTPWELHTDGTKGITKNLTVDGNHLRFSEKSTYTNYSRLGNKGGEEYTFMVEEFLPPHNHPSTGTPSNNMSHTHMVPTADVLRGTNNVYPFSGMAAPNEKIYPDGTSQQQGYFEDFRLGKGTKLPTGFSTPGERDRVSFKIIDMDSNGDTMDISEDGNRINDGKDLKAHTHPVNNKFSGYENRRHYNVPPFVTIAYYVKYDPYQ